VVIRSLARFPHPLWLGAPRLADKPAKGAHLQGDFRLFSCYSLVTPYNKKMAQHPQLQHATISKRLELKDRDWDNFLYPFKFFPEHINFSKFD
jgi:hypothetical protein